jgi:hypothetical protein
MGATIMSDYVELINPQTMVAKLLKSGEIIAEYKVAQCDHCSTFQRLDEFGYQKGQGGEKLLWFCGGCR